MDVVWIFGCGGNCVKVEVAASWELNSNLRKGLKQLPDLGSELLTGISGSGSVLKATNKYTRLTSVEISCSRFPNGASKILAFLITLGVDRESRTRLPDGQPGRHASAYIYAAGVRK